MAGLDPLRARLPVRGLAIDDDPDFLDSLQMFISQSMPELSLECETKPKEALRLLEKKQFDLVLCDLRMPSMDGVQFLREARRVSPRSLLILMSSHGAELARNLAGIDKVEDVALLKPLRTEPFVMALRHLLDTRRGGNRGEPFRAA